MIHRLTQTVRIFGCTIVACVALSGPVMAGPSAETTLADQLAFAIGPQYLPAQSRIALAPPPPLQSALPMAEVEAIMARVVQNMVTDWPAKPRILAGSADLRSTLALVRGRQGQDAWRQTVTATLRQEAEFVLVGETGLGAGQVTLRLTLVALDDGRVLAKTSDVAITAPTTPTAASPREAITEAITQFQQSVPQAKGQVTIGPFVHERSGFETPLGRALADIAVEAWLVSAQSISDILQDAPAPVVLRGPAPNTGFFLSGTIRLVNRDRFQLILRLSNGQNLRATRTLELSALRLPPPLRASIDPQQRQEQSLLDHVQGWVNGVGPGSLKMQSFGGTENGYDICETSDFSDLHRSCPTSLIQLAITSDIAGALLCFSLDDQGRFSMILPNAYAESPRVFPHQNLLFPDHLPPLPDGTRMYWPAMGPASQTLVTCLLFEQGTAPLAQTLTSMDGTTLRDGSARVFLGTLKDSGPEAGAALRVQIIE